MLDEAGTVNPYSNLPGGLNAGHWQAASGPEGTPRLAPQAASDENWRAGFTLPGVMDTVYDLVVREYPGAGGRAPDRRDVYVGGWFETAGDVITNGIAKWVEEPSPHGRINYWAPVSGITGTVYSLALHPSGQVVYAGGYFDTADEPYANIAACSADQCSALGGGTSGPVYALAVPISGWVYARGAFDHAGGVSASNIALWNGVNWLAVGGGVNGAVRALVVDPNNGDLYVGGDFTTAGGVSAQHIAKWDGSNWSPVGGGTTGPVYALALYRDGSSMVLYAGGAFAKAGGVDVNNVARWDGSDWAALGGFEPGTNGSVQALTLGHAEVGVLLAGGAFTTAGGVSANNIAVWDGSNWSPLGSGMTRGSFGFGATVYALAVEHLSNWVYAGGEFTVAGEVVANRVARWGNGSWHQMGAPGNGMSDIITSLAMDSSGNLYAGGGFTTSGDQITNHVARWDGTSWSPVGGGRDEVVDSLTVGSSDDLYVGSFSYTTAHVVHWDGSNWHTLGSGMTGGSYWSSVDALAVSDLDLYAGGNFTTAGGTTVNNIARWSGGAWLPLGAGTNDMIRALALDSSGNLYAGGAFTTAGGVSANYIAKWDGSNWSSLGSGLTGDGWGVVIVEALLVDRSDNLYAGGDFTSAGGVSANNIAKWDGSSWSPLGDGTKGPVTALTMDSRGALYAAVIDLSEEGRDISFIAKWDGNTWTRLDGDLNGPPLALLLDGDCDLYAGGSFSIAGGKVSAGVAHRHVPRPYDFQPPEGVDIGDLQAVASRWRDPALYDPQYDVMPTPPGVINILDIMAVAAHLGDTCP